MTKTRNGSSKTRLIRLARLAILSVIVLAIYAGLPIYARLWHIAHGNSMQCGELTVQVPGGWWGRRTAKGCELITPIPAFTLGLQHPIRVYLNVIDSAPDVGNMRWREDVMDRLQREGNIFRGTTDLVVGGMATVCFEWSVPAHQPGSAISCNINSRMVVNLFYDDQKLRTDFYQIVHAIR